VIPVLRILLPLGGKGKFESLTESANGWSSECEIVSRLLCKIGWISGKKTEGTAAGEPRDEMSEHFSMIAQILSQDGFFRNKGGDL
jgi:hypothetical protein